jgi:hypothetical protein
MPRHSPTPRPDRTDGVELTEEEIDAIDAHELARVVACDKPSMGVEVWRWRATIMRQVTPNQLLAPRMFGGYDGLPLTISTGYDRST